MVPSPHAHQPRQPGRDMHLLDSEADHHRRSAHALPCRQNDADLWFAEAPADLEHAKALCQACPLRAACLAGAKDRAEPWGVWGGELFQAGEIIARKRPRGRPRKNPVAA